jgi:hypothetical protein
MSRHSRTIRLLGAVALASSLAACEGATTPTQPRATPPPPPPPPSAGLTVSGRVLEFMASGANRPVPNLRLKVRMGTPGGGDVVGGVDLADIVTDADGRYTISDVSALVLYFQAAPGSDYRFLCEFHPIFRYPHQRQFQHTDLPVVHVAWSGNQPIPGMRVESTSVYGTVSERVGGSLQPVAGASVSLDGGVAEPPATTSATGFYMICSINGSEQFRNITAQKSGYMTATRQIFVLYDMKVDLELGRN